MFLLANLQSASGRVGGPICVGRLITSIDLALNLCIKLVAREPLEMPFVDLNYCHSMCLIKNKPDDKYFLVVSNREVRSVTLPSIEHTNVRVRANWLYDVNAPAPDANIRTVHMERDAPETSTYAHTAHDFTDSFVGTSVEQ